MGDGAKAMSKAGREVFCDLERCFRLMCWAHVHRNICPQLKCISAHRKDLAKNILVDIENLQWSVLNEATFRHVFTLLEKKYLDKYNPIINDSVSKFFKYMRTVWVESEEFRWYEGAHPWQVSNNQGVEGKNKEIKQSHTFRERLELGALFGVMLRLVKEWAEEEDILLTSSRLAILHNDINSLKMRTQGYQWFRQNKFGSDKVLKINPKGKYSVSEEFLLGKVDNIWSVASNNDKSGRTLKERTKDRIQNRAIPSSSSFDEYISMRSSCWILEERDGDYFCDCPIGMKGKMCKHTVGLLYKEGHLEQTSDVRAVPLGAKRRKGRPKKLPNCLARSPIAQREPAARESDSEESETDDDTIEVEVVAAVKKTTRRKRKNISESQDVIQSPVHVLHNQSIVQAGLGCSKPPKKRCRVETTKDAGNLPRGRKQRPTAAPCSRPAAPTAPSPPASTSSGSTDPVSKPNAVNCKKRKGSCNHVVAFGQHFNEIAWKKYADYVKTLSSATVIDQNYIP